MDIDSERMLPRADEIIVQARTTAEAAASALAASEVRTRNGIVAVGIGIVALGFGFSWLIGRSITRPLNGLAGVMKQLAAGDTSARIPATQSHDEIGDMARTVIVFRDSMIEREQLAARRRPKPAALASSVAKRFRRPSCRSSIRSRVALASCVQPPRNSR